MTTQVLNGAQAPPDTAVELRTANLANLNWLYLIIPASIVLFTVDKYLYGGYLGSKLPVNLDYVLWFNIVFNSPHILCSALLQVDGDCIRFYGKRWLKFLLVAGAILAVAALIRSPITHAIGLAFVLVWTIKHVIGQQLSLAIFHIGRPVRIFWWWKHTATILASLLFLTLFRSMFARALGWDREQRQAVTAGIEQAFDIIFPVGLALLAYLTWRVMQLSRTTRGKVYIAANGLLVFGGYFFWLQGYYFLVGLAPRVVHDLSAFYVYSVASYNKNKTTDTWNFFRPLYKLGLPPLLYIMGTASLFGFVGVWTVQQVNVLYLGAILSIFHFYTESVTWKGGSLLRSHLRVAA
jgi:hypothetical protein